NLKIPEAFSLLEEAFHSSNPFVAIAAVKGIKKYGGKRAEKILLECAKHGVKSSSSAGEKAFSKYPFHGFMKFYTPEQVRISCIRALGELGGEEAVKVLGELLRSTDKRIKREALSSLGKIAFREKPSSKILWWLGKVDARYYLQKALKDSDLSDAALEILACLGEKEALDLCKKRLKEGSLFEKVALASSLAKCGYYESLEIFKEALTKGNKAEKVKAVEALQYFGGKALPLLTQAAHDPSPEVRAKVVDIAGKSGESGEKILLELLKDENRNIRREAIFALTGLRLGGSLLVDYLLETGTFTGFKIERKDLVKTKPKEKMINKIKKYLPYADEYTQVDLAVVLLSLGERDVSLPILHKAMKDKKARVIQKKALIALAEAGDTAVVPYLESRIWDCGEREPDMVWALYQLSLKSPVNTQTVKKPLPTGITSLQEKFSKVKVKAPVYSGSEIIGYLEKGEKVRCLKKYKNWVLIEFEKEGKREKGWISEDYLE
ncbi:MAG TPA: hypothetical protein ENG13_04585, partial [bacterium]|nr:hypothetical protein [bacterium]HEX68322.1 hypothetical protein [bacterium]